MKFYRSNTFILNRKKIITNYQMITTILTSVLCSSFTFGDENLASAPPEDVSRPPEEQSKPEEINLESCVVPTRKIFPEPPKQQVEPNEDVKKVFFIGWFESDLIRPLVLYFLVLISSIVSVVLLSTLFSKTLDDSTKVYAISIVIALLFFFLFSFSLWYIVVFK